MTRYGFLGLGIMGEAMATNLVKAGFDVTVWNRTAEKCRSLTSLGAQQGKSPSEVVASCDVTFAMLADPDAAWQVFAGPAGVREGLSADTAYVDMSTVDAATASAINEEVAAAGGRFLEAPVSGTKKPARDGTLVILAAGDRSLFEEVAPAFDKMGKKSFFFGEVGQAARMKLVINMIMGGMMTAFCEGLSLGQQGGLNGEQILEVLDAGALANPMFKIKGGLMLQEDFSTSFPLEHMQKDLRLAIALGDELKQPLPCSAVTNETFKRACAEGYSKEDFAAVFKTIR